MGLQILVVVLASLILVLATDLFLSWYLRYLKARFSNPRLLRQVVRLIWAILALLFWMNLSARRMVPDLNLSHLLFALFIYSLRGLMVTFYPGRSKET